MNPFFSEFYTPFHTIPFDKITIDHFLPAMKEGIKKGLDEIEVIVSNVEQPTFSNTIEALEKAGALVEIVSSTFFNLNSCETSNEIQSLAKDISPLLSDYGNDIMLNEKLFKRIEVVYKAKDKLHLNQEQTTLLTKTYKSFVRNGSTLHAEDKNKLRTIDKELAQANLIFEENVLAESNAFKLVVKDKNELTSLPEDVLEAAQLMAKDKGETDAWVFTLDYPSYIPFMMYSDNRALKEKLFKAFASKGFQNNKHDNQEVVKQIVTLRFQRAQLLGYESHAQFVLEERMAESPQKVNVFLNHLLDNALPFAQKEKADLTAYAKSIGGPSTIEKWDMPYYSELHKKEKFSINDELLKPYFKLENVIQGVFDTASKLYNLKFIQRFDIPLYHKDVTTYEVQNDKGELVAVFYADYFPRASKRQGAWMTSFKNQRIENDINHRPHVSIVCNFTKPTETKPSLLTFDEVTTLFHEFGHALHGMCANTQYGSLSGTSVYWDFVELPSQIFENWCFEKECLDLFAKHYLTGESIPEEYIQKIIDSANFQSGLATVRQIGLGLLDMAWHQNNPSSISNVKTFEVESISKTEPWPTVPEACTSCSFSHIFPGGYSSGYYSYKWAEVIDADAFEAFKEKGIFNKEIANSFFNNILSAGGSEHPSILYKKFRGREADPKALLRRSGLI